MKKIYFEWIRSIEKDTIYSAHIDSRHLHLLVLFTGLGVIYPLIVAVMAYQHQEYVNATLDVAGAVLVIANFILFMLHRNLVIANIAYSIVIFIFFLIALFGRMVDGTSLPWISFFNIIIFILSPIRVGVIVSILFGSIIGLYLAFIDLWPYALRYSELEVMHLFVTYSCTLFGGLAFALSFKSYFDEVAGKSERLQSALQKAKKASLAKSEFLANMSHEIRTPIHTVIGISEILADGELSQKEHKNISSLNKAAQSLSSMINDILDMAKIESGKSMLSLQIVVPKNFLESIIVTFQRGAREKGLEFEHAIINRSPHEFIRTDGEKLKVIVSNLLSNALKYTDMGKISFTLNIDKTQHNMEIEIKDTGRGIKKDHLKKIFQAFSQAEKVEGALQGAGLGLTLVKNYVDMFDGTIRVYSVYGQGATFRVRLPMQPVKVEGRPVAAKPSSSKEEVAEDFSRLRVLVVEDHAVNRNLLMSFLKKVAIEADAAEDGLVAVEACRQKSYDLVFMDIRMPNMDGVEATQVIRGELGQTELFICAVTANAFDEDKERCLGVGMNEFLVKPMKPKQLYVVLSKVNALLQGKKE
ncbi:MAG: response regulator [Zetaproteobacteria bacterium]|nr:response regulator [Zetaproteobacteria bacterium]